jgi:hypothetical protein
LAWLGAWSEYRAEPELFASAHGQREWTVSNTPSLDIRGESAVAV